MLTSAEVRWFFGGPVPDELEEWFCRTSAACTASAREDLYLRFPASLGLNVKLREGRLEIKSLVMTLGARTFTPDVAGTVQMWKKWSGADAAVGEFERLRASAPDLWIAVRKERTLRKFSGGGASIVEVDAGRFLPPEGCNVELTGITVDGTAHWSLAFEAYGDPARVEETLTRVAARVLTDQRRPRPFKTGASSADAFSADNSRSYPEWLDRFSKKP